MKLDFAAILDALKGLLKAVWAYIEEALKG